MENEDNKFTWGDAAVIKKNAPAAFRPGEYVAICGFSPDEEIKEGFSSSTWRYTAEFGDGSSIEILERYLEPYFAEQKED